MEEKRIEIGGAVAYFKLAPATSMTKLAEGLRSLGLEDYLPEPRTPLACLRGVLGEMFPAPDKEVRHVVRPVKNEHKGFAVVCERPKEHASPGDDWGKVVISAKLDDDGDVLLEPYSYETRQDLQERIHDAAEWLPAASVSKMLVSLIERLRGVSLRTNGGVYWISKEAIGQWRAIGRVVEQAAADPHDAPSCIYSMTVIADEEMVRAVGDSLTDEIEQALATMEEELKAGNLQEEACMTRIRRTAALADKVRLYEQAFDRPLTKLHDACNRAAAAAAMAALEHSAAGVEV